MNTISLCMIVKNEEDVIARCLSSVEQAIDEIIVVDTGSTDRTKEIVATFSKAKLFDFTWINDFSVARNFSFNQASSNYILWLDADDVIGENDLKALIELKNSDLGQYDYVSMNYHLSYDQKGNPTYSYRRNRLVKRSKNYKWIGPVHEYLEVYGHSFPSSIAVSHKKNKYAPSRNIDIYLKRLEAKEEFNPRDQFYFANELKDHSRYEEAIEWYEKFLTGKLGWVEDNISACYRIAMCYEQLNDLDTAISKMFRALTYDRPRPDFCYQLGGLFFTQSRFKEASFWYSLALQTKEFTPDISFHNPATATWLPLLQLTVCYDRLGKTDLALAYHAAAMQVNPDHPSIQYNDKYFRNIGLIKEEDPNDNKQMIIQFEDGSTGTIELNSTDSEK